MASPIMELMVKLGLDKSEYDKGLEDAEKEGEGFGSKLKSGIGGVAKAGLAATGAAVAAAGVAVGGMAKQAVDAYANYEQLVGGVEKLYGEASNKIQAYAKEAYATSGMSANQYMETATSFSASLINSLGGDVDKAAELTDVAMRAMSDNVNVFGSDAQSVQNAFQGFAKQNYTMLDNLKLGYGGTKTEMERLIADANTYRESIGETADLSIDSFADVVQAIQSIQEAQHIAGTTNKEAMTTIQGSAVAAKAAWENVITAIGSGEDLEGAFDNLISAVFGSGGGGGILDNLIPRIQQVMEGIGEFVEKASPYIAEKLPALMDAILPNLLSSVSMLVQSLASALPGIISILIEQVPTIVNMLVTTFLEMLPVIVQLGLDIITALSTGIADNLPELVPQIVDVVIEIVNTLLDNIDLLIDAGLKIILGLTEGVVNAVPKLIEKMPTIIAKVANAIITSLPQILAAGVELVMQLVQGITNSFGALLTVGGQIIDNVGTAIGNAVSKALTWGGDLIDNFIQGIKNKFSRVRETLTSLGDLIKGMIGFSEPKDPLSPLHNFHTFAPDMMDLFIEGIDESDRKLKNAMQATADIIADGIQVKPVDSSTSRTQNIDGSTFRAVSREDINVNLNVDGRTLAKVTAKNNLNNDYRSGGRQ